MREVTRVVIPLIGAAVVVLVRLLTAVRADWRDCQPSAVQRIYFANHTSHGDFILLWAVLPPAARATARPVAAADYWLKGSLRRLLVERIFRGVMIDRHRREGRPNPIRVMLNALDEGASLIVFPEGTRNATDASLLPFKSGIYHLAAARPSIELVPAWIENLNRVLPKGESLPVPLLCTVTFGKPIRPAPGETAPAFLQRARRALLALSPASPSRATELQS